MSEPNKEPLGKKLTCGHTPARKTMLVAMMRDRMFCPGGCGNLVKKVKVTPQ